MSDLWTIILSYLLGVVTTPVGYFFKRWIEKKPKLEHLDLHAKGLALMEKARALEVDVSPVLQQAGIDMPDDTSELKRSHKQALFAMMNLYANDAAMSSNVADIFVAFQEPASQESEELALPLARIAETGKMVANNARTRFCTLWETMDDNWIREILTATGFSQDFQETAYKYFEACYRFCLSPSNEARSDMECWLDRLNTLFKQEV